jgi:hypothetical protein
MKFIEVSSDWDYGALTFENSGWDTPQGRKELYDLAVMNRGNSTLVIPGDPSEKDSDIELNIKALSYGPIDKEFYDYVMGELVDRDMLAHINIYIVEE